MKITERMMFKPLKAIIALATLATLALAQEGVWSTKKSGWQLIDGEQRAAVFQFGEDYKSYLLAARSALTSTREVIRLARAAGFEEFSDSKQVKPGARLLVNGRDRAVILAVVGSEPIVSGSRVVGTHHDSPHIDLKARPFVNAPGGLALLKTVYYGGIKKYQWANEPLALIGRIDTTDGRRIDVSIGTAPGDPVFVIPDNAPHSDTELHSRTYQNVLSGEELDPVVASIPGSDSSVASEAVRALTAKYKIKEEDFVSGELQLVPAAAPADVGIDRGLVGAYGQDDRLSSYCAARAIIDLNTTPRFTALSYLSNNEEVGSVNNTGAASQFLNSTYARLIAAQRGTAYSDLDLRTGLRNAQVISADCNDGVNPIFPQTSEASNAARLGFGVTIKRYGHGFDANSEFIAKIRALLDKEQIPWQTQTPKVDVGVGGTIGGFMSAADMEVIDLGVPLLSMHATFEMSSKVDVWNFYRLMVAFFRS
ncbi:MAG TPA: peptidase M18 [Blastocatellia bacterium]|nr:peptidase M18 [Blastocatellia bacterium]